MEAEATLQMPGDCSGGAVVDEDDCATLQMMGTADAIDAGPDDDDGATLQFPEANSGTGDALLDLLGGGGSAPQSSSGFASEPPPPVYSPPAAAFVPSGLKTHAEPIMPAHMDLPPLLISTVLSEARLPGSCAAEDPIFSSDQTLDSGIKRKMTSTNSVEQVGSLGTPSTSATVGTPSTSVTGSAASSYPSAPFAVASTSISPKPVFDLKRKKTLDINTLDLDDDRPANGACARHAGAAEIPAAKKPNTGPSPSAELRSVNLSTAPDLVVKETVSVGRAETCDVVLADPRVSAEQFVVSRGWSGSDGHSFFELEDKSRNGTLVSKRLVVQSKIRLQGGDLIEVMPAAKVGAAAQIGFIFYTADAAPKTRRPEAVTASAVPEDVLDGAICAVCQDVMHRAVSAQPCQHSFCSSCLSTWLSKRVGAYCCPICRGDVSGIGRNLAMDGVIEGLLKVLPAKKREESILKDMDDGDLLWAAGYNFQDFRRRAGAPRAAGAPPAGRVLPPIPAAGALFGGFVPAEMAAAVAAAGERVAGMIRAAVEAASEDGSESDAGSDGVPPPPANPCFHCGAAFWKRFDEGVDTLAADMDQVSQLIGRGLQRNRFEQGILVEWVQARGGLKERLKFVLENPNPEGAQKVRPYVEKAPSAEVRARAGVTMGPNETYEATLPHGSWAELKGCKSCVIGVLGACVYSLRERIPSEELPANARTRENCWYGRNCRSQRRPEHATRLNHICEQVRF